MAHQARGAIANVEFREYNLLADLRGRSVSSTSYFAAMC